MAEQFLDSADIIAVLKQVCGKRVAEGVAGDAFGNARGSRGVLDGLLDQGFMQVVAEEES